MPKQLDNRLRNHYRRQNGLVFTLRQTDRKRLEGKNIIITGATGGIGKATALRLAMEGATVGLCGRSEEKLAELTHAVRSHGGTCMPLVFNMNDMETMRHAVESFVRNYGTVDALINNAGGSAREKSADFVAQSFEVVDEVLRTNLWGTMACTHQVMKHMNNGGTIVNLGSIVGLQGKRGMTDYAAAKAGLQGFTRSLAIEGGVKMLQSTPFLPGGYAASYSMKKRSERMSTACNVWVNPKR